jgi:hypothetical protein
MQAKARLLSVENISGTSRKTGNDYSMDVAHFLDLQTFDKMRLNLPKDDVRDVRAQIGKDGVLDVGFDPRTEKITFVGFKTA